MFETMQTVLAWVNEFSRRFPPQWPDFARGHGRTAMVVNGLGASVMLAPRLTGESKHALPPGVPAPAYPVAEFAGCPEGWRHDGFFVPIPLGDDGKGPGMWYDWTMNKHGEYDVAVVPSTTGMNPITGQRADALRLERYVERCPIHNASFGADRSCGQCGFRWPAQSYVAAPNTLWWDGFRLPDGTVRQFSFSDDILGRDVGVAVLGADRVPAFGFACFRTKEARPKPMYPTHRGIPEIAMLGGLDEPVGGGGFWDKGGVFGSRAMTLGGGATKSMAGGGVNRALAFGGGATKGMGGGDGYLGSSVTPDDYTVRHVRSVSPAREVVGVGAGAEIGQDLTPDPKPLDAWRDAPDAVMTVYFVTAAQAEVILSGERRPRDAKPEGYLGGLSVKLGA